MMVLSPNSITVVTEATPDEISGLPADAPPNADTPAPDRCVLPNAEEGLVGAIPPIDPAFDVAAIEARPDRATGLFAPVRLRRTAGRNPPGARGLSHHSLAS